MLNPETVAVIEGHFTIGTILSLREKRELIFRGDALGFLADAIAKTMTPELAEEVRMASRVRALGPNANIESEKPRANFLGRNWYW